MHPLVLPPITRGRDADALELSKAAPGVVSIPSLLNQNVPEVVNITQLVELKWPNALSAAK